MEQRVSDNKASTLSRRDFVRALVAGGAAATSVRIEGLTQQGESTVSLSTKQLPTGKIGNVEISRLILGGNLISGYAHARDLIYVADLMRRYNTEKKILETLELAEEHGIDAINLAIWDEISFLRKHWNNGGKMKLIAQALPGEKGELDLFKKAIDFGAAAVHIQGHGAERLWETGQIGTIGRIIEYVKSQGVPAGVAAHALDVIVECEKAGLPVDFYVKTLHHNNYPSVKLGVDRFLGKCDNLWCTNPDEVIEFMHTVKKPWIAFKVMAAGAIHPREAFRYAVNGGADFILAGMFDWQIKEDVSYFIEAIRFAQRLRPWYG